MTTLASTTERTLGDHLRDEALERVLSHCPPEDEWRRQAVKMIGDLARTGAVFEAYELTIRGLPDPVNPSRWGAVFHLCAHNDLIELAGYGPSSRPTVKRSAVRFWRGAL